MADCISAEKDPFYGHEDPLALLDSPVPLRRKLEAIHASAAEGFPGLQRVAVASYDPATDLLKTLIASSRPKNTLVYYDAKLADSPSLKQILAQGRPRVVNDLAVFSRGCMRTPVWWRRAASGPATRCPSGTTAPFSASSSSTPST